jgi:hypothetical protein
MVYVDTSKNTILVHGRYVLYCNKLGIHVDFIYSVKGCIKGQNVGSSQGHRTLKNIDMCACLFNSV